ncbi:MAG TPA: HEAT repeat domain-containing protein [Polyangia bacterium]|nr:HEAT repeat domain-containing protein [Polyangia bacterium]
MGIFDLLSKEGRKAGALKKSLTRAVKKDAQSADRMRALEILRDDASDEAIYGLCRRFSFIYDKTIEDEQEKHWVESALIDMGEGVLPMLRKYLLDADSISWPLRVLDKVAPPDQIFEIINELVERNEPGYVRDPSKKIQMLTYMGEHREPRISDLLVPYLEDMDEGVRFTTVESLVRQKSEAVAREPLLKHFIKPEEESGRIKIRIAEGFADLGWEVKGFRGTVEKLLPDQFLVDGKGRIKRKGQG